MSMDVKELAEAVVASASSAVADRDWPRAEAALRRLADVLSLQGATLAEMGPDVVREIADVVRDMVIPAAAAGEEA